VSDNGPSLDGTRLAVDQYLAHLDNEYSALSALADGDLEIAVPACPGWSLRDLVSHVVGVYRHKAATLESGNPSTDRLSGGWGDLDPSRPPVAELRDAYIRIRTALTAQPVEAEAYTFWPAEQTVGFWVRRMPQETAVHRWDADAAVRGSGGAEPIASELALDGVDELLGWLTRELPVDGAIPGADRQEIVVTSGTHAWTVTAHPTSFTVVGGVDTDDPDAWVTGEASDLLLFLWGRREDDVACAGDPDALAAFRARLLATTA